jgi:hypothetical protein
MGIDHVGTGDYEVFWSRWDAGSGWSGRQRIYPNNTQSDRWPRLAMAEDGTPWVVWLRRRASGSNWDLLSSRCVNGNWTVPDTVVAAPGMTDHDYWGVAPADTGRCWVVYGQYDGGSCVRAKRFEGGRWGAAEEVVAPPSPAQVRQVDADLGPDGEPWAVWGEDWVKASRRWPDGSWEAPVILNAGRPDLAYTPAITVDCEGEAWTVWHAYSCSGEPGDRRDVFYARTIDGAWQPCGNVSEIETADCAEDGSASVDASHGWPPRAVWDRLYPGSAWPLYREPYTSAWDSQAWTAQSPAHASESSRVWEDVYPSISIGPDGTAWAAWMRASAVSYDVYASHLLLDVIDLNVARSSSGVEIGWRLVGSAQREDFAFAVKRASEQGDTTWVCENLRGHGNEYFLLDESADPRAGYTYWIEVLDLIKRMDPATGPLLFRTNTRRVEPTTVSVGDPEGASLPPHPILAAIPNPAAGAVVFRVSGLEGAGVLEVFDVQGRRVWSEPLAPGTDETEVAWRSAAASGLSSAVYWARVRPMRGGPSATTKIVMTP